MYSSDKLKWKPVYTDCPVWLESNCGEALEGIGGKDEILLLIKDLQKILKEKFDCVYPCDWAGNPALWDINTVERLRKERERERGIKIIKQEKK